MSAHDVIQANNESFLVSSLLNSAEKANKLVRPTKNRFDAVSENFGFQFSTMVDFDSTGFNKTNRVQVPRQGFSSNGSFVRISHTVTDANQAPGDIMTLKSKYALLESIDRIELKTKKAVITSHTLASLKAWLENINDEDEREAIRLMMCQGVLATTGGVASLGSVGHEASTVIYQYIPLNIFPFWRDYSHSLDMAFIEPMYIEITFKAESSLTTNNGSKLATLTGTYAMSGLELITKAVQYDADAYNRILKDYASMPKIQMLFTEYYENQNTASILASANPGASASLKLEGMRNVITLYIQNVDANGVSHPLQKVELKDGGKILATYTGAELKNLVNLGTHKKASKDNFVYQLEFSLSDSNLGDNSWAGSVSVDNLIDPRLVVYNGVASATTVNVVGKQYASLVISTSNGVVSTGASY